ncbi:PIN domain-containing protein [Hydrogenivirga sp.]
MPGYLIDTDVCIDFLRGADYARNLILQLFDIEEVYVSILTRYELLKGAFTKKHISAVGEFLSSFETLFLEEDIVDIAAEFYRIYRKRGITLADIDCLIMATAKVHSLKIITRNVKHYPERDLLSEFSLDLLNNL